MTKMYRYCMVHGADELERVVGVAPGRIDRVVPPLLSHLCFDLWLTCRCNCYEV